MCEKGLFLGHSLPLESGNFVSPDPESLFQVFDCRLELINFASVDIFFGLCFSLVFSDLLSFNLQLSLELVNFGLKREELPIDGGRLLIFFPVLG